MSLLKSFGYAFNGLRTAWQEQRNLKIHSAVAVVVIGLGIWFNITTTDWCILALTIGAVIATELLNTAIENLTDLVTKEYHPLAGKVKDIAASAVLVLSGVSIVIGAMIFLKYV